MVIKSIDRLGRNYEQITEEWRKNTSTICADILVLDIPILDTREKNNSLMGKFVSDLVLQILSFVAENERENIKLRQAEGISQARQRGVKFGRPAISHSKKFEKLCDNYLRKELSLKDTLKISNDEEKHVLLSIEKLCRQKQALTF